LLVSKFGSWFGSPYRKFPGYPHRLTGTTIYHPRGVSASSLLDARLPGIRMEAEDRPDTDLAIWEGVMPVTELSTNADRSPVAKVGSDLKHN
jgi:hypothetical protein